MRIQYFQPLSRGIERMKKDLFKPFDLGKWFVIGFTAFLAGFGEMRSSGIPNSGFRRRSNIGVEDVLYFPRKAWEWLAGHPGWAMLICIGLCLLFVIGLIFAWLSSRGKFMFLDNVVRSQAKVSESWREYKREGNSFFLWSFALGLIVLATIIAYVTYCFMSFQALYEKTGSSQALLFPAILAGAGFIAIAILGNFFSVLLRDFIVPIMYRDRISTIEAIQKFSVLFSSYFIYFLGYALFLLALWVAVTMSVVVIGCATCCIGFIILMIPYINAVVLLPITYAIRAFSLEFLEQFGPGYDIFPKPELNPPDGQTLAV